MEPIAAPPNPFVAETGSLVIPSFEEVFFLPGDWLIYLLSSRAAPIADMLGISPADYGGTFAGFIAWFSWILLAIVAIAATSSVRRFDRALTGRIIYAGSELRRRWRMALATNHLRRSSLSLARIAEEVGYETDAAFSRAFRREFGVPPATWRRAQATK